MDLQKCLINSPDEEFHTLFLAASFEQCSALGKDWHHSCMGKWSRASSKVICAIFKTCFFQLPSIGDICIPHCFRQSDVPEICSYMQRLSVYLPPLLSWMTNTSEWCTSGAEPGRHWTARLLSWPSEEQLCTLQTISVAERSGLPCLPL